MIGEFKKDTGMDISNDSLAMQRIKEAAEKAKCELSSTAQTDINLPFLTADKTGPKHLNIKMNRAKLESLVEKLIERTLVPCKTALKDSGISATEINEVIRDMNELLPDARDSLRIVKEMCMHENFTKSWGHIC